MTEAKAPERHANVPDRRTWGVLAVVTGALFLEGIDTPLSTLHPDRDRPASEIDSQTRKAADLDKHPESASPSRPPG